MSTQSTQTQGNAEIQTMMSCHFVWGGITVHKLISLGLMLFGKNKARLLPYYIAKQNSSLTKSLKVKYAALTV